MFYSGCGSTEQSSLAISHRNAIREQLINNDHDYSHQQYGFVISPEIKSADPAESTFDLVVPCLPRGAMLELVPMSHTKDARVTRKFILDSDNVQRDLEKAINDQNIFQVVIYENSVSTVTTDNQDLDYIRIGLS